MLQYGILNIEEFDPKHDVYLNKKKSRRSAFIIDDTKIQIGSTEVYFWIAIEPIHQPIHHRILLVYIYQDIGT